MSVQSDDKQDKNSFNGDKILLEQLDKKKQLEKNSDEEKFTWHVGDIEVFDSVDDIPGFQPFALKNKNKQDTQKADNKKTGNSH